MVPGCQISGNGRVSPVMEKKHLSLAERSAYRRLEDVIGCKWSAGVVAAIGEGVRRPGELERYVPGISKKILNERLRKLRDFGLIARREFAGAIPRVEYSLTPTGRKLADILRQIRELQEN
jgi:DNA-binding HxlR family transcriptional regulator